jgi:formate dehydrogenase iron-sulfur subunit
MINGSLCAMGGMTPFPVLSALNHFPEDFAVAQPVDLPTRRAEQF